MSVFRARQNTNRIWKRKRGKTWKTISHDTYAEYQSMIPDIVLESTLI